MITPDEQSEGMRMKRKVCNFPLNLESDLNNFILIRLLSMK